MTARFINVLQGACTMQPESRSQTFTVGNTLRLPVVALNPTPTPERPELIFSESTLLNPESVKKAGVVVRPYRLQVRTHLSSLWRTYLSVFGRLCVGSKLPS